MIMKNYKFNELAVLRINLDKLRFFSTHTVRSRQAVNIEHIDNYISNINNNDDEVVPINPWFVTGFTDAEGSFMIHLEKNKDKWRVRPTFQIKLDIRDLSLLEEIKIYFNNTGSINTSNKECVYKVRSLKDISIIISHFDKYNLITQKKADFELFKLIINKLNSQEHLSYEVGATVLQEIISIRASMNLGLSSSVKEDFPHIIPVIRPLIENMVIPHPEWMAGFVSGEGSFSVYTTSDDKYVSLSFRVSQHNKDKQLLKSFVDFFGCGGFNYHNKGNKAVIFVTRKFEDINDKIIPLFNEYKIKGVKYKDFKDWSLVAKMIESKSHLTTNGYKEICKIKENMNSYRKSSVN
uniref:LAGLIDADG endonuclease n=1 Tax=Fusarium ussurianum TaxID=1284706 RepID=UPI002027D534|nr:LAGLIDADG endonuclease [Fusarium ussurianum]UPX02486.1 LAGLIDADG endonuclease [Fusarium ussurianum]UPX02542.1 LAGLIDADG endonuclease [Fusarium ussurianum]